MRVPANEPLTQTKSVPIHQGLEFGRDALVLRRALSDLDSSLKDLSTLAGQIPSDQVLRRRGTTLARAVIYWSNRLPTVPDSKWSRTRQVNAAAQFIEFSLRHWAHLSSDSVETMAIFEVALEPHLNAAQRENRILGQFKGNTIDVPRTGRIIKELIRRLYLDCETALTGPNP